jgi:4-alpha-glucanotransferase
LKLSRSSGVFLHPTSLPSPWGVGDLGPGAYRFVDLLQAGKQSIWQVLPLTPVAEHGSPYSAHSLFGGNTLLLSPEKLVEEGFLGELPRAPPVTSEGGVDFGESLKFKNALVRAAFDYSYARVQSEKGFADFRALNSYWLDDYALYRAIAASEGKPWYEWPEDLRRRDAQAVQERRGVLRREEDIAVFSQYLFEKQWTELLEYAHSEGVRVLGDVPFYVLHDSADIWSHTELFKVSADGEAEFVGGVPPDYFSKTGQRWGNPVYDWQMLEATGYEWWRRRVERSLRLSDMLRLDHFRGYVAYWEIPANCATAVEGSWVPLPRTFLDFVKSTFPSLPFLAEDLGVITEEVNRARERLGIPGMRVLQFGFDGSADNPHFPENFDGNTFVYTGTHDTNTARGWYEEEATSSQKHVLVEYLGHEVTPEAVAQELVSVALKSAAEVSMIPVQDLLGLGSSARMNNPATRFGNWRWRTTEADLSEELFKRLGDETASSGRG